MTLKADLIAARALIDTPEKWGRGSRLRHPMGSLCAIGAFQEAIPPYSFTRREKAYQALRVELPPKFNGYVADFNDAPTTTHADIMSLFQRAIDNAGEME